MFFSDEDHLRVTKVRTVDGNTPYFDEQGRPITKTVFMPLNRDTKKLLEEENTRKPNHLKLKIEVMKAYKPTPVPVAPAVDVDALQKKLNDLEAENKLLKESKAIDDLLNHSGDNGTADKTNKAKNLSNESK